MEVLLDVGSGLFFLGVVFLVVSLLARKESRYKVHQRLVEEDNHH